MKKAGFNVVGGQDVGDQPPPIPPNQSCLDVLNEALELAKSGRLQTVFMVGLTSERIMVNAWSETDSVFEMIGAVEQSKLDFQNRRLEQFQPLTVTE